MLRVFLPCWLAVWLAMVAPAGELRFTLSGGDQLTVRVAGAEKQAWKVVSRGDQQQVMVAALVGDRLILEEFSWSFGPGPHPEPGPQPEPQPQPIPGGPKTVLWIEESAQRTPSQAAAVINQQVRQAMQKHGWHLRIVDQDVVDETGKTPADLAPYIDAAKKAGLPRLFILQDGTELYAGVAPPDASSLSALLSQFGLVVGSARTVDPPPPGSSPTGSEEACPGGRCPVPANPTIRRWRLIR